MHLLQVNLCASCLSIKERHQQHIFGRPWTDQHSHDPVWPQFGTDFQEMNAYTGRQQTTKGIWLARSTKVSDPLTLVLDLEGSDGRERGEDDNSFERQSSLFALAVTDILVVNMWAKDVGREAGAGKPLLKTIFQVGHTSSRHSAVRYISLLMVLSGGTLHAFLVTRST